MGNGRPVRKVERVVEARLLTEGAGVTVRRTIGLRELDHLDPFLLLDAFGSDDPEDYRAGFPWHPHRGIETVTYMKEGKVRHEDSIGNAGVIGPGEAQWMTAGGGIVHSEMPGQDEGVLLGFQLWVNLPAREKMCDPRYQDIPRDSIPEARMAGGARVRVIAGRVGEVEGPVRDIVANPLYLDVDIGPGSTFSHEVTRGHTAFVFVHEGEILVGQAGAANGSAAGGPDEGQGGGGSGTGDGGLKLVHEGALAVLGDGDLVRMSTRDKGGGFLLVAGKPIGEPMVRWGPFVMNTRDEIRQALSDYRDGTLQRRPVPR